jgi:uncharacterized protein (TIGR02594 family)
VEKKVVSKNESLKSLPFLDAPWLKVARQEIGQEEIEGKQHNPRILEYHATTSLHAKSDEVAWCSSFVNWCLKQIHIRGTNSAAAASWLQWGQEVPPGTIGAITVIYQANAAGSNLTTSGNHVGFLVNETETHIELVGGNQKDQVKISSFRKKSWKIKSYRWPAWKSEHKDVSTPKPDQEPCKILIKPLVVV